MKNRLFIVFIIVTLICCIASNCFASELFDTLVNNNSDVASAGDKPTANLAQNIDTGSETTFDRVPGQYTDGQTVAMGEISPNQYGLVTDNTHAAALSFDQNAFQKKDGSFDLQAYTDCRGEVAAFLSITPNASESDINNFLAQRGYEGVTYECAQVRITSDGIVVAEFKGDVSNMLVSFLGTNENPEGKLNLQDICNQSSAEKVEGLPFFERTAYFIELFYQNRGYLDLMSSVGNGEDIPGDPPEEPEEPEEPKTGRIYAYTSEDITPFEHLEPNYLEASIYETSNHYDADVAVPTSEDLTYKAKADSALYFIEARKRTPTSGVKELPIKGVVLYVWTEKEKVTYTDESGEKHTKWEDVTKTSSVTGTDEPMSTSKSLTSYDVKTSDIYPAESALVYAKQNEYVLEPKNNTIDGNRIKLNGLSKKDPAIGTASAQKAALSEDGVVGTYVVYDKPDGRNTKQDLQVAYQNARTTVYGALANCVSASSASYEWAGLVVNGNGISGEPHVGITEGTATGLIDSYFINGRYEGKAYIKYEDYKQYETQKPPFPNDVVIHTPVVNETIIVKEPFINQKINQERGIEYLQLDTWFEVNVPIEGIHISARGYSPNRVTREYNSFQGVPKQVTNWGKLEDVKCDFDTYLIYTNGGEDKTLFIPAGTWLSEVNNLPSQILKASGQYKFRIPVWVQEGDHKIWTKIIAENAYDINDNLTDRAKKEEEKANLHIENYTAVKTIPVYIIGKIYDLQINNSNDKDWDDKVQSQIFNTDAVLANEFPFGLTQKGRNNLYSSITNIKTQNKNSSYAYAPKLGSAFIFNFKTKGRKSNNIDISVAQNGFYFVSKDGGNAVPVNLYYKKNGQYKKLGTGAADLNLRVAVSDGYLRVEPQEPIDSNRIYPIEGYERYNYSNKVDIGTLKSLNLPHSLRMCFNNFMEYMTDNGGDGLYKQTRDAIIDKAKTSSEGGSDRVIGSVGRWYAGYALPDSTIAVKSSVTDDSQAISAIISNDSSKIMSNGYILVLFDIVSNDSSDTNPKYLKYYGPEARFTSGKDIGKEEKTSDQPVINWIETNGTMAITLPNGKNATVPKGVVTMYEADVSTQVETVNDIVH